MVYRCITTDHGRSDALPNSPWLVRDDVMGLGYEINLEEVCLNQSFTATQVVSSELVFPRGAVPNAQILWIRIELTNGERKFITKSLASFYDFVSLPESSIGGWTEGSKGIDTSGDKRLAMVAGPKDEDHGDSGSDSAGHNSGHEADDQRSSEAV